MHQQACSKKKQIAPSSRRQAAPLCTAQTAKGRIRVLVLFCFLIVFLTVSLLPPSKENQPPFCTGSRIDEMFTFFYPFFSSKQTARPSVLTIHPVSPEEFRYTNHLSLLSSTAPSTIKESTDSSSPLRNLISSLNAAAAGRLVLLLTADY